MWWLVAYFRSFVLESSSARSISVTDKIALYAKLGRPTAQCQNRRMK